MQFLVRTFGRRKTLSNIEFNSEEDADDFSVYIPNVELSSPSPTHHRPNHHSSTFLDRPPHASFPELCTSSNLRIPPSSPSPVRRLSNNSSLLNICPPSPSPVSDHHDYSSSSLTNPPPPPSPETSLPPRRPSSRESLSASSTSSSNKSSTAQQLLDFIKSQKEKRGEVHKVDKFLESLSDDLKNLPELIWEETSMDMLKLVRGAQKKAREARSNSEHDYSVS
uniref:Uncharacterized protein n=1 Tax=Cacopsylla melanoneura TaxID=428564 RepID=A0A8D8TK89_9HEMI